MKVEKRNIEKDGVLINIYFFCKALNIKKPDHVPDPISFMNSIVESHEVSWDDIADKVRGYRDAYKQKRRSNHKKKTEEYRKEQTEFFNSFSSVEGKMRCCLKCDTKFFSKVGNRMCDRCNYIINNFLGDDGMV